MGDKALILARPVPGLTDDDGVIAAPHHLKSQIGRLGEVARQLTHTAPGSRHHAQLLARYRKLHHVVAGERRRWHHPAGRAGTASTGIRHLRVPARV